MRVMALFSTSFFAKCLRVGEDGPGQGHLCHIDRFLIFSVWLCGRFGPQRKLSVKRNMNSYYSVI